MLPLLLVLADGAANDWIKAPPSDWLQAHSGSYGFDITPHGSVWINVDPPQTGEDYAILANDLYKISGRWRTVWMRGYFKHAPKSPIVNQNRKYQSIAKIELILPFTLFPIVRMEQSFRLVEEVA